VVSGCPFSCDPESDVCHHCTEGEPVAITRTVRIVTLPLGATEDRVIGTLDLKRAIQEGIAALDPGILAAVHRGILYIDEVNLLDDHIIDILLDAAAMGVNTIEREGVSVCHPSRFILVGTMNPEEGELRPQLLDRFGLMVNVTGITDTDERIAVINAAEAWNRDPGKLTLEHAKRTDELQSVIIRAQEILPSVQVPDSLIRQVVHACLSLGISTHRAEITVIRTAKTIAAFEGRVEATAQDVKDAMALALPHRMRKKPFEEPELHPEVLDEMISDSLTNDEGEIESETQQSSEEGSEPSGGERRTEHPVGSSLHTAPIWKDQMPDRNLRKKARGQMIDTLTDDLRGRRTTIYQTSDWEKLAIDATIRAAAPRQRFRTKDGKAVAINDEDLRRIRRKGKAEIACVFVVDASGSMGAEKRMESAKGAILSLLKDSYIRRDRVGLVAFRGSTADIVLPLSRSPELALQRLKEIPTGGRTPLGAGLMMGMDVLNREKRKKKDILPMLMLISDGRANVGSGSIREELQMLSGYIASSGIRTVVLDTESVESKGSISLGYCREIADASQGAYYSIADLSTDAILSIAQREQYGLYGG
jgi:magnesium chelatase subunit D